MEEKEVNSIASAVTAALAKLNKETPAPPPSQEDKAPPEEVFNCPECGNPVKSMSTYCPQCGCELEWAE